MFLIGIKSQRRFKFVLQAAEQTDAVFELGKTLIALRIGEGLPGQLVELIRGENKARTVFVQHLFLEGVRLTEHTLRFFFCIGTKRGEMLAKASQPDRDESDSQRVRCQGGKILQRAIELRAVVEAGTQNHLAVEAEAVVSKTPEVLHDPVRVNVVEHLLAKLTVGGLYGDVERTGLAFDNPVHLLLGQIGQRYKIARHEGKPPIVIAHI